MSVDSVPFVDGWDWQQDLGEGTYGEVRLAVNRETNEGIAVKIVHLVNENIPSADVDRVTRKEIAVHRLLSHDNVIKFYGYRTSKKGNTYFIFLEYAPGGELFDRIEPDIGMPPHQAQRYFKQLLCGVEYLHSIGVAHRDIKPENLLLDEDDQLKLADFGLATLFRHQGRERLLTTNCGTPAYAAPELMVKEPYHAQPADAWSCGIVLVAMLAGELPWDNPVQSCSAYKGWLDGNITVTPWKKIQNVALSLLRRILLHNPSERAKLREITEHRWMNMKHLANGGKASDGSANPLKRFRSDLESSPSVQEQQARNSLSQPDLVTRADPPTPTSNPMYEFAGVSISQPAVLDNMLLGSQYQGTQGNSQTPMQRLVKRMTRFFVKTDGEHTMKHLCAAFEKLSFTHKKNAPGMVTISTLDCRRLPLTFKATIMEMGTNILCDFRLSKGDGIEFKKCFLKIREELDSIINKKPPAVLLSQQTEAST